MVLFPYREDCLSETYSRRWQTRACFQGGHLYSRKSFGAKNSLCLQNRGYSTSCDENGLQDFTNKVNMDPKSCCTCSRMVFNFHYVTGV